MFRGMFFSMSIVAAIFCLHLAINTCLLQSRGSVPSCESVDLQNSYLSLLAIVDINEYWPPDISTGSEKESSNSSESQKNTMPGWAKHDVEDLPQINHAFLKIFHNEPTENFGLSLLSDTPTWPDKNKLRTLRPPVRAAPHA